MICPHTGTSYLAVKKDKNLNPTQKKTSYVVLATAHPCKFPDVFEELNIAFEEPEQIEGMKSKQKKVIEMSKAFEDFKEHLLK